MDRADPRGHCGELQHQRKRVFIEYPFVDYDSALLDWHQTSASVWTYSAQFGHFFRRWASISLTRLRCTSILGISNLM